MGIGRTGKGKNRYSTLSLWDTFRAWHPMMTLLDTAFVADIVRSALDIYEITGELPVWPLASGETGTMIGYHSVSVIADAWMKGIRGFDGGKALEAMVRSAEKNTKGADYYIREGYIPANFRKESVSCLLEFAYDDWCIMKLAQQLNRPQEEIDLYRERSKNYRFVFDKESKLMRGKNEDGTFQSPFSPYKWGDAFTEGNSWHYTWSVFHDVQGLIDLMGGKESFVSMLDSVFVVPPIYDDSYYGQCIHEIKEMQIMNMGNYAHGNQPIQHMIYLYNYAGQPWKAQYWLREVMDKLYTPYPDGYCGDEDNGQTSAWYIFSALGFYPVCPGSGEYVMGAPLFKKAILTLENGKQVILNAPDNTNDNRYICSLKMNGKEYNHNWLKHEELMNGAVLDFNMSHTPNTQRGVNDEDFPYSLTNENK